MRWWTCDLSCRHRHGFPQAVVEMSEMHDRKSCDHKSFIIAAAWPGLAWLGSVSIKLLLLIGGRGSSVGRARDSWSGGPGLDPRCGRPLPTGWVGVSIMWPAEIEVMVSQLCLMCGST